MATVSRPASVGPPNPPPGRPAARGRSGISTARIVAIGGLGLVVLIVAYLVFSGGGGGEYQLIFENASQIVRGDQVEVGGVPVGTVKNITLTNNYRARITVHIEPSLTPLHVGTTAAIRVVSLFGVANRYIALSPGPNNAPALPDGATISRNSTQAVVDLDQVFDTFSPKTRRALQNVITGSAQQYEGAGVDLNTATEYFPPALSAADHIFSQLVANEKTYTDFLVEASKALTTISAHKASLTGLVSNANTTFAALVPEQANLTKGLDEIPRALHEGNQTFTELPPTLDALTKLVNASKPATKNLAPFFGQLDALLVAATPVLNNLSLAVSKPGPKNDLTDAALELPALAKSLESAAPHINPALQEAVPITAFFGPYTPDFEGLFRDFSAGAAYYDANGHYARVTPDFADFKLGENNTLTPVTPQQGLEGLKSHQLQRCPGAATQPAGDGSSPFTDNGQLSCDPSQTP